MATPKKEKKLTVEQVQQVVAEIDAWNARWSHKQIVEWVSYLWDMPGECYLIRFEDQIHMVYRREPEFKQLRPANWTSYYSPHWTDNPRYSQSEKEQQEES